MVPSAAAVLFLTPEVLELFPQGPACSGLRSSEAVLGSSAGFCWVSFHGGLRVLQIRELSTAQDGCGPKTRRMLAP